MAYQRRKSITSGVILILIGAILLALQVFPTLNIWAGERITWPMIILVVALVLLVIGALTGTADMLVPASIVGGIGTVLHLQVEGVITWESWAYLWTLIPGFAGLGVFLAGLVKWNRREIVDGLQTILVSSVLFVVFGSVIGDQFGVFPFRDYLPVLLIGLGVFLLIRAVLGRRR